MTSSILSLLLLLSLSTVFGATLVKSFEKAKELYNVELNTPLTPDAWQSCGTPSDVFDLQEFSLTPDPPKAGSSLAITAAGTLKDTVSVGTNVTIKVKYNFITIYTLDLNLCQEAEKLPDAPHCPIAPGPLSITQTADIPANAPPGRYNIRAEGVTDLGKPLFCVSLTFRL